MKELIELTSDVQVTSWVPADVYADLILDASACYNQISGVVTAIEHNISAGEGDIIQVRYVPARVAQGAIGACGCLSATSSTLGTYPITIYQYGDYDLMCGFSMFKAGGQVKDRILNAMAVALAVKRDNSIVSVLLAATAATKGWSAASCSDSTSSTTYCCAFAFNLYNSIVSLQKSMQAKMVHPDYVLLHPSVSKFLYYKDYTYPPGMLVKYDGKGGLDEINGLKVIETCNDSGGDLSCTNAETKATSKGTIAIVIDSSRAVGEAWGKRPEFSEIYDNKCNRYQEVVWMYWGTAVMDTVAVGHVLNP